MNIKIQEKAKQWAEKNITNAASGALDSMTKSQLCASCFSGGAVWLRFKVLQLLDNETDPTGKIREALINFV